MVKSELIYNPYLMEISVKFNGQSPHINSLIEKYQGQTLEDWISVIPQIFYDEMNGYFFELDFSGTELDCEEIKSAFRKAKVSEDEVTIFLKNELEPREIKADNINSLLLWLDSNPNRKFDYTAFRQKYHELFDENYTYITIHNSSEYTEIDGISIENVDSVNELECTDLTHTPIMFYISKDTLPLLASDVKYIVARNDVIQKQIFFLIANDLKRGKVRRTIVDLGIREPNIVTDMFDEPVKKYLMVYPISDYIYDAIKAFRAETEQLSEILAKEIAQSELDGKEIHLQLDTIEDSLIKLKNAAETISQHDNLAFPSEFANIKNIFIKAILEWRNKKTKMTKAEEAFSVAVDFNADIHRFYGEFCSRIDAAAIECANKIRNTYLECYESAETNDKFTDSISYITENEYPIIGEQTYELLKLKEEKFVVQRSNFIGQLFKSSENNISKEPVLETTFYYQVWREHMNTVAAPAIETVINNRFESLKKYSEELADIYHSHLTELINKKTDEKNSVASQLSEEEKLLQKDNDWLSAFVDQIKVIERS